MSEIILRSMWLAFAAAISSALVTSGIVSGVDRSASIVVVWLSYFLGIAVAAFVAFFTLRLAAKEASAFWFAVVVLAGLTFWCGARPPYPPTLDQLVDSGCRPRLDLLPYTMTHRRLFWASVAVSAERSLEGANDDPQTCAEMRDSAERQDCIQWLRLKRAEDRYCRDHANRQLRIAD